MDKIKILYIITKSDVGGAQKYVTDLTGNLDKNRFAVKILYGGKDIRWLSNKLWPWALFLNDWLAIVELISALRMEKPDIIHLNSSKAGIIGSLAAFFYKILYTEPSTINPKIVFTAHGWVFNPTNALPITTRWFYILLHKFATLFQNKIICVSEYDYQLALQYRIAPKEKLATIHNGINTNLKFLDKESARKELSKGIEYRVQGLEKFNNSLAPNPLTLNPKWPWIGSIGRLVKEKNYGTFIEAAEYIAREQQNNKTIKIQPYFFLIGEGAEKERLQSQIADYKLQNRFFIIDPTGDDAKYLKAFDIFAMSSIKEGLPYVLLEAMAAELPIVVTEAGGIPEIIKNHKNGMMVAQKNPEQLAQAISGLLANPSITEELGRSAKKAVTEHFNINEMTAKTEEIYKKTVSGS